MTPALFLYLSTKHELFNMINMCIKGLTAAELTFE